MDNRRGIPYSKCCCKCVLQPVPNLKEDAFKQAQAPRPNRLFSENQPQIQIEITYGNLGVLINPA